MKVSAVILLALVAGCFAVSTTQEPIPPSQPISKSCYDVIQEIVAADFKVVDADGDGQLGLINVIQNLEAYDTNADNEVSRDEMRTLVSKDFPGALPVLDQLMKKMDYDGNKVVTDTEALWFLSGCILEDSDEATRDQYFEYWSYVYEDLYKTARKTPGDCKF